MENFNCSGLKKNRVPGRSLCLSIWGFGWKPKAFTGILKTQSRQNLDDTIYGIEDFSSLEFLIQLYEPMAS